MKALQNAGWLSTFLFKSPSSKHKDIVSPWDNDFNILKAKFFHTGKLYTF
jgi:hypothetical protein